MRAFGAEERSRVPLPDGRFLSVELRFGDSTVMLADEFPELDVLSPETIGGTAVVLHLTSETSTRSGSGRSTPGPRSLHPLADQFWGNRQGQIADPFGHRWNLAQPLREVTPEELARAAAAAFG